MYCGRTSAAGRARVAISGVHSGLSSLGRDDGSEVFFGISDFAAGFFLVKMGGRGAEQKAGLTFCGLATLADCWLGR